MSSVADALKPDAVEEPSEVNPPGPSAPRFTPKELLHLAGVLHDDVPFMKCSLQQNVVRAVPGDVLLAYIIDCEQHGLDCVKTPEAASEVANQLLQHAEPRLLLRTQVVTNEKGKSVRDQGRKVLQPVAEQGFRDPLDKSVRYVWLYKPPVSGWFTYLPVIVVLGILAVTMFPLWPMWLKRCVFWLSAALLVLLTAFLVLRYMLALLAWLAGFELWIIPRFWDEAATIVETFDPLISAGVDPTAAAALPYRGAVLALLLGVGYWAASAPEQVEGMVASQRAFVEDLYSGALMADASEVRLPGADRLGRKGGWGGSAPRVRAFDDIWKELEEEEQAEQEEGGDQGGEEAAGKDEALDEVDAEIPEATAPDVDGLAQEAADEEQDVDVSDADIVAALLREQAAEQEDEAD